MLAPALIVITLASREVTLLLLGIGFAIHFDCAGQLGLSTFLLAFPVTHLGLVYGGAAILAVLVMVFSINGQIATVKQIRRATAAGSWYHPDQLEK